MGLLEFGLGKPIRMDIRPGFLKGIPVEIFWRTRWRRIAAGMLAAAAFLFNALEVPGTSTPLPHPLYVFIYVRVHIHAHVRVRVLHMHIHINITHACVCVCVWVCIYIYMLVGIYICICICICIYLRMHAYVYGDVYMHLCTEVRRSVRCTCE